MYQRLLPLMGIMLSVWLLIFAGSFVIFRVIVPLPDMFPGSLGLILTSIFKVAVSALLVAVWIYIMILLRNIYVKRKILSQPDDH